MNFGVLSAHHRSLILVATATAQLYPTLYLKKTLVGSTCLLASCIVAMVFLRRESIALSLQNNLCVYFNVRIVVLSSSMLGHKSSEHINRQGKNDC